MTNEQAIEYLSESTTEHKIDDTFAEMHNGAITLAIQALEKQIPKQPIEKHYEDKGETPYIKYKCPSKCGSKYQVLPSSDKYCMNCGQALDWSD